jgi:hypothetical protein
VSFIIIDSGVLLTPSFSATSPMTFAHFMGKNPSVFRNGIQNHDTQSIPWVFNHLPLGMPNIISPFPSSPLPTYINPSFGSEGMMAPFYTSSFDGIHIPQLTLTVGGWNLPSCGSNPGFTLPGASARMGSYSAYYTLLYILHPLCHFPRTIFP